jgi:hypothetical protein
MAENMLSILRHLVAIFRRKTHNRLALIVIGAGITLAIESQVNFLELVVIAAFEQAFGPSEIVRTLFVDDSLPWIGVALVVAGLTYHFLIKIGLAYIDKSDIASRIQPEFELVLFNIDGDELGNKINFRGKLCKVENLREIPDYSPVSAGGSGPFSVGSRMSFDTPNYRYYRERAKLLTKWGGAEVFTLCISNIGECLSRNVRVLASFPKIGGLLIDNENDPKPGLPASHKSTHDYLASIHSPPLKYDIKSTDYKDSYEFEWDVGDLQAKATKTSYTSLFVRPNCDVEMKLMIFCDEFSTPRELKFAMMPPEETLELGIDEIMADDDEFDKLADDAIMDRYITRQFAQYIENYENDS